MKKRILALAALMSVSVMLTACTSSDDVKGKLDELGNGTTSSAEQQGNSVNNEKTDSEEKEPEGEFKHGKITDTSYSSSYFGIEVEFDSNWTAMSDEEMAEQNNIDDMSDENVNKVLNSSAIAYEMMAGLESGSNVNIVIENLKITNNGKSITAEEYMTLALPGLRTSLESTYEESSADIATVSICGKEMPCIKAEISNNGMKAYEALIPVVKGNYAAVVTFTALDDDDMNTMIGSFKSIG